MKKFLMLILGLVAITIFLFNLGPMILLGVSIFLLYMIYKQFVKSDSTSSKLVWIILGLFVLSMAAANAYSIIGLVALLVLYVLIKNWKTDEKEIVI